MTDVNTLHNHLTELAAMEKADCEALASLSKQFLTAGASLGALSEILVPQGWRFAVTQSGEKLEVARQEELYGRYRHELKEIADWRNVAHDESWHEQITAHIHRFIATHTKLNRYLRTSEGLGDVYDAIDTTFAGTGAEFNGMIIGLTDELSSDDES
jgi:hypothetical protein